MWPPKAYYQPINGTLSLVLGIASATMFKKTVNESRIVTPMKQKLMRTILVWVFVMYYVFMLFLFSFDSGHLVFICSKIFVWYFIVVYVSVSTRSLCVSWISEQNKHTTKPISMFIHLIYSRNVLPFYLSLFESERNLFVIIKG